MPYFALWPAYVRRSGSLSTTDLGCPERHIYLYRTSRVGRVAQNILATPHMIPLRPTKPLQRSPAGSIGEPEALVSLGHVGRKWRRNGWVGQSRRPEFPPGVGLANLGGDMLQDAAVTVGHRLLLRRTLNQRARWPRLLHVAFSISSLVVMQDLRAYRKSKLSGIPDQPLANSNELLAANQPYLSHSLESFLTAG
jgi:hypothetical protein